MAIEMTYHFLILQEVGVFTLDWNQIKTIKHILVPL